MADSKRQSAGKVAVATPNIGATGMVSIEAALSGVVGARIRLTTSPHPQTLEGTVFTYCPITHLLAINTAPPPPTPGSTVSSTQPGDYHIIPVSKIQSFTLLSVSPSTPEAAGFENVQPAIGTVDLKALKAREEAAVRRLREKEERRGRGVGKEGQEIFDALGRTLPTRWHNTSIIVLDAVIIAPPYRVEDCEAPATQQRALTRVKKVLENERKKLADRAGPTPAPAPEKGAMRKGG